MNDLRNKTSWIHFSFTANSHLKCIISRLPHEFVVKFEEKEEERCLKYVNGEGIPIEIKKVLQHATTFFLDLTGQFI